MPDAPLQNGKWLIEIAQGEFILLGIGDVNLPDVEGIKRIGIGHKNENYLCFLPIGSFVYERYGDDVIYLLRPDGHIAASFDRFGHIDNIRIAYQKARAYTNYKAERYA